MNRGKTGIQNAMEIKYLGFSFYIASKKRYEIRIHPKSVKKMKDKIRKITKRSNGHGYQRLKRELNEFIRGWVNYFKVANMKTLMNETDQWLRHRIRCYIWKSWKNPRVRRRKLESLNLSKEKARMVSGSREGLWKVSNYQDIKRAITNKKLSRAGYPTFKQYYL